MANQDLAQFLMQAAGVGNRPEAQTQAQSKGQVRKPDQVVAETSNQNLSGFLMQVAGVTPEDVQGTKSVARDVTYDPSTLTEVTGGLVGAALKGSARIPVSVGEFISTAGDAAGSGLVSGIGEGISSRGQKLKDYGEYAKQATRGADTQQAMADSPITGNLFKPSTWDFGPNPSIRGIGMQMVDVLGEMAPIVVASVVTKKPMIGGALGGLQGSEGAREQAEQAVDQVYQQGELYNKYPEFKRLVDSGMSEAEALAKVKESAADWAQILTLPVSTFGGYATGSIVSGKLAPWLASKGVGSSLLGRIGLTGLLGGLEEGTQEVAESLTAKLGTEIATGGDQDYGEGTFADFFLGALSGGTVGAVAGGMGPGPDQLIEQPDLDQFEMEPELPEPSNAETADGGAVGPNDAYNVPDVPHITRPETPDGGGDTQTDQTGLAGQENFIDDATVEDIAQQIIVENDKDQNGFSEFPDIEVALLLEQRKPIKDRSPLVVKTDKQLYRIAKVFGLGFEGEPNHEILYRVQAEANSRGIDLRYNHDTDGIEAFNLNALLDAEPTYRGSNRIDGEPVRGTIVSLDKYRDIKKLEEFHQNFNQRIQAGAQKLQEITNIAEDAGAFKGVVQGTRLKSGDTNYTVEHIRVQKVTPNSRKTIERMYDRLNLGDPEYVEFGGELYVALARVSSRNETSQDLYVDALLKNGAQIYTGPRGSIRATRSKFNEFVEDTRGDTVLNEQIYDDLYRRFKQLNMPNLYVDFFPDLMEKGYNGFAHFAKMKKGFQLGLALEMPNGYTFAGTYNHELIHVLRAAGLFSSPRGRRVWQMLVKAAKNHHRENRFLGVNVDEHLRNHYPENQWEEESVAMYVEAWTNGQVTNPEPLVNLGLEWIRDFWKVVSDWFRSLGFNTVEDVMHFLTASSYDTLITEFEAPDIRGWEPDAYITAFDLDNRTASKAVSKLMNGAPTAKMPVDYYNRLVKYGWNVIQLAKKNIHIPWLQNYVQYADKWNSAKSKWLARANDTAKEWMDLTASQQDNLANMLLEAEQTVTYKSTDTVERGQLTPLEVQLAKQHKLSPDALRLYIRIRGDFRAMLNNIETVTIQNIMETMTENELAREIAIGQTIQEFAGLKKNAYFPHARFGQYTLIVKDKKGKNVYVEMFEKEANRNKAFAKIKQQYPESSGFTVAKSKLSQEAEIYRGIPEALLVAMKTNMNLDKKQQAILEEMIVHAMPAVSFKKHFVKKQDVKGYSRDALRAYAEYFWHGANHIARVEYGPKLEQSIQDGEKDIEAINKTDGGDSTVRREIADHLKVHYKSIMNPKEDWASLRSVGFLFWLGFNVKSAVLNLSQIPLVSHSYLASNFGGLKGGGDVKSMASLTRAMAELRTLYRSPDKATSAAQETDLRLIAKGIEDGFLDESFAAELAGLAEGNNFAKSKAKSTVRKLNTQFLHAAGYLFQATEKINRRVTFMAAVRLARSNPNVPYLETVRQRFSLEYKDMLANGWTPTEATAFLAGKDVVESTQFNYAAWARPRLTDGKQGVIFTFFMFTQNMLWFIQNSPGSSRYLLTLLLFAGIQGMPWEEDLEAIANTIGQRMFGKEFNTEKFLREQIVEMVGEDVPPDLFLHGISRYGFGLHKLGDMTGVPLPSVDMSANLGMGSPLPIVSPGIQATAKLMQGSDFNDAFSTFTTESMGATLGIGINMIKAMSDGQMELTDPKRWEQAMPAALAAISKALRYNNEGRERSRTGATVMEFDPDNIHHRSEIYAQAMGFNLTRKSQAWDRIMMQAEAQTFWSVRRQHLYDQYDWAKEKGDADDVSDVMKAVNRFNQQTPYPDLRLTRKKLEQSYKRREKGRSKREAGLPDSKMMTGVYRDVERLHPETQQNLYSEDLPSGR